MASNLKRVLSLATLASALCAAYVVYARLTTNDVVREANEAVEAAIAVSLPAQAKSREVGALLNESSFKNDRAKLTATARKASMLFGDSAEAFKIAADKLQGAIDAADTVEGRTYYTMKRDSLVQRASTAEAGQEGYSVAADETCTDFGTMMARMNISATWAEKAKAEADRLTAEANAFREQHRGKF